MTKKVIGQSMNRWDAYAKVTGKARYTADIPTDKKLYAKICRATITHGIVKNYDISEALKVDGVVKFQKKAENKSYVSVIPFEA